MADTQLVSLLQSFKPIAEQQGCYEVFPSPIPTLANPIHPLFALNRWVKGHDQHTTDFYSHMNPALRLASLVLTDGIALTWFNHLRQGSLQADGARTVIAWNHRAFTPERGRQVRGELARMAEYTTIMFVPRAYSNTELGRGYGCTAGYKDDLPWLKDFRRSDFPPVPRPDSKNPHRGCPVICLNAAFQECLRVFETRTQCANYRFSFMLAATLVHEVAHAYWFYLGRCPYERSRNSEPYWTAHDKRNELGFSLESMVFGQLVEPFRGADGLRASEMLVSLQKESFGRQENRSLALQQIFGGVWTDMDLLPGTSDVSFAGWRGDGWFYPSGTQPGPYAASIVQTVPMWWVHQWFNHDAWEQRRRIWRAQGRWQPPGFGPTIVIVCQRNPGAQHSFLTYATSLAVSLNLESLASNYV